MLWVAVYNESMDFILEFTPVFLLDRHIVLGEPCSPSTVLQEDEPNHGSQSRGLSNQQRQQQEL